MRSPAVLLHGFAGTGRSWDGVRAQLGEAGTRVVTPDLPGHGTRRATRPVTFDACVDAVLSDAPEEFVLCGYSMGGRVALHVAVAAPERVLALVLVSATAGIEDAGERAVRKTADDALADAIEGGTIAEFADRWMDVPLFAGDPAAVLPRWREDIVRNEPAGLAAALRGIGTGAMTPLWDRLAGLVMPAIVVTGSTDARFTDLGARLATELPDAGWTGVPHVGHALPRVAPAAVAGALRAADAMATR